MGDRLGQARPECRRDRELAVILQAWDQPVEREGIGEGSKGAVECGWMPQAGAAQLAPGGGDGALRTLRPSMPGQVGPAAIA